jgi:hypothetical protein
MNYLKLLVGLLLIVLGVFVGSFISLGGHSGAILGGWIGGTLWCLLFWSAPRWPV